MFVSLNRLARLLPRTMRFDRPALRKEWERLRRESPSEKSSDGSKENKNQGGKGTSEPTLGPIKRFEKDEKESAAFQEKCKRLEERILKSVEKANERRKNLPKFNYDPELPICARKDEIAQTIRDNQVVVVCGETGSGKSTQLPKICLELGLGIRGMIGHTQPRRIAARAVARRIAEELGTPLGVGVGYKVRFSDQTGDETYVKLMTDGILLAESQQDPFFNRYDVIIIDEAHERSLNIDFLLGMMKRVLARRRDLKLIITSATIDAKRFADHFAVGGKPVPVIEVSGRTYPIEILYRPPEEDPLVRGGDDEDADSPRHRPLDEGEIRDRNFLRAVDELALREHGDILVFLPTQRDILETAKLLKYHPIPGDNATRKTEILPLYARLSFAEQQKIFSKSRWRKIVLATNVAESSLTVPGIRYVIDFGTARISRYSSRSRTQRLPIEAVSRASADQRAGRCGRIGPGVCIRLYSREDYLGREEFTTPEIRRTNLASVILQTIAFRLGAIEKFPFLDPPAKGTILEGYKTLFELGAIDSENRITEIGRRLSRLPIDPRLARMIVAAIDEGVLNELLVITAALAIQDPRERPIELAAKADEAHAAFQDENSDFVSYLKLWDFWQGLKDKLSGSQLRKACHQNFLSFNRMREWSDIHIQLLRLLRESNFIPKEQKISSHPEDYDAIHRSILTGMLVGIAQRGETSEYTVAGNGKFSLWPGSGLFKKKHRWLVAAERVETTRRYLRCAAKINPEWIEPLAEHLLVKKSFDPFWLRETGYVHAYQRITLFGITIVPKRRINFGPVDPAKAREIFIYHALVQGDFDCNLDFFVKNQAALEEAVRLQAKLREYDLLKGEMARLEFYQSRIPENVYDKTTLARWFRPLPPAQKKDLLFTLNFLCQRPINASSLEAFPDAMTTFSGTPIPLDYQFRPGEEDDGLTATIVPEQLGELATEKRLGWLIPGLLEQKVAALLKTLPKEIRRSLVPIPDTAREIVRNLPFGEGDFYEALCRDVSHLAGRLITPRDFDADKLPTELLFNLRVVDEEGNVLAEGRDPDKIQEELGIEIGRTLATVTDSEWMRDGLTRWEIGSLPESVTLKSGKRSLTAYPAICDPRFLSEKDQLAESAGKGGKKNVKNTGRYQEKTVSLRLFDNPQKAAEETRLGILRLFTILYRKDLKLQADNLPQANRLKAIAGSVPYFDFAESGSELIARFALETDSFAIPRNEGDFNRLMSQASKRIGLATQEVSRWFPLFLQAYHEARLCIEKNKNPLYQEAGADSRETLDRLLPEGFHLSVPWEWLKEYPRYLKAIPLRYDKLQSGGAASDREYSAELAVYWDQYRAMAERHENAGVVDPALDLYRWMLEEYQVSLFAQRLGTSVKVSAVRLQKQWDKIEK